MNEAIILDTETTDKEGDLEVIEMAWQCYGTRDSAYSFESMFEPERQIKWGAIAVHHILPMDLTGKGYPPSSTAVRCLPTKVQYIIGHNIDFDWKALGSPPLKRICTLAMSRALWPELDAHNLTAVYYFLFGANPTTRDKLRGAHRAYADVMHCYDVLEAIISVAKVNSIAELWEFSEDARVPKIMTFGKHKGKRIEEVDRGYSNWYRKQSDTDPYLLEAFKRAGI